MPKWLGHVKSFNFIGRMQEGRVTAEIYQWRESVVELNIGLYNLTIDYGSICVYSYDSYEYYGPKKNR